MTIQISVIVPCFNGAETLAVQLEALTRQDFSGEWEVIVADNGSTDGTREIAKGFADRLPHFQWVDASGRKGAGHARNEGARVASGDCLAFCDADDEVADGWVSAIFRALTEHDFVASRFDPTRLNSLEAGVGHHCPQQKELQPFLYPRYLPHCGGCGIGIKRRVHQAVGGFDESLLRLQDTDYAWRVQLSGTPLHFAPEALVHVRLRATPKDQHRQARLWGEYNVLLYKRYRPRGMPKITIRNSYWELRKLSMDFVEAVKAPSNWPKFLFNFHWMLGRLLGCIKYRVIAL